MRLEAKSLRAWGVTLASIALLAMAVPVVRGAATADTPEPEAPIIEEQATAWEPTEVAPAEPAAGADAALPTDEAGLHVDVPCEPPPAADQGTPGSSSVLTQPDPAPDPAALQATFRLCGTPDPQTERALEQLIAGRGFSARLVSRPDGCADLTVKVPPQPAGVTTGRASSRLVVSTGGGPAGPGRTISVQIVSENGATRVSIGAGQ